jgi:hypothetical protein
MLPWFNGGLLATRNRARASRQTTVHKIRCAILRAYANPFGLTG